MGKPLIIRLRETPLNGYTQITQPLHLRTSMHSQANNLKAGLTIHCTYRYKFDELAKIIFGNSCFHKMIASWI